MIYPINKIYTEVKNSVASLCKNTSRTFKSTTKTLPFLYFKVLGNPSTFNDLDNNENAIILTIEIHVYTSGTNAMSQAEKIFKLANDKLFELGFARTYGIEHIENAQDTTITQLVARYRMTVCEGDF